LREEGDRETLNAFKVSLGPKVTTISTSAFANNKLTGNLSLPNTLTMIDASAFEHNQLNSVQLDKSLTTIGDSAFANNHLAGTVTIPDLVTTVGDTGVWAPAPLPYYPILVFFVLFCFV